MNRTRRESITTTSHVESVDSSRISPSDKNQKKKLSVLAAILFIGLNAISLLTSFIENLVIAQWGGASAKIDAYLSGKAFPDLLLSLLRTATHVSILPVLVEAYEKEGVEKFWRLSRETGVFLVLTTAVFSAVAILISPYIVSTFLSELTISNSEIALRTMQLMFLAIPFATAITVFRSIFMSMNIYWPSTIPGILRSTFVVISVLVFATVFDVYSIPLGLIVSYMLSLVLLLYLLRARFPDRGKGGWHLRIPREIRLIGVSLIPVSIALSIYHLYNLLDRILLSGEEEGVIARLNYAFSLLLVAQALIGASLGTLALPSMSQAVAHSDHARLRSYVVKAMQIVFLLSMLVTALYLVGSEKIVRLAFQRGEFNDSDTVATTQYLRAYMVAFALYGFISLVARALVAVRYFRALILISFGAVGAKILVLVLLIRVIGPLGAVYSTSFSMLVFFVLGFFSIRKYTGYLITLVDIRSFALSLVAFIPSLVSGLIISRIWPIDHINQSFADLMFLFIISGVSTITYIGILFLLRSDDLMFLIRKLKSK